MDLNKRLIDATLEDFCQVLKTYILNASPTKQFSPVDKIPEGFIEIAEAVVITHLSKPTIYRLKGENAIPHYKRGRKLLFKKTELLEWVANAAQADKGSTKPLIGLIKRK